MKLYINNIHHIKTIPSKFVSVKNILDYLEDEHHKRLLKIERKNLELVLFEQYVEKFLEDLRKEHPLVAEQIAVAKPIIVYQVTTNDGQRYYVLKFSNNRSVRCNEKLFRIAPLTGKLKYANSLAEKKILPPSIEQLQLSFSQI